MSILCAVCHTENRETAMFCKGCAAKLPAFVATGPSALEIMKAKRPASRLATAGGGEASPFSADDTSPSWMQLPAETRSFWLRGGLFMLIALVGFMGWYLYATRKPAASWADARPSASAAATATPGAALSSSGAGTQSAASTPSASALPGTSPASAAAASPETSAKPASEVPVVSSLTTGELMVAPGPEAPSKPVERPASPRIVAPRQDVGAADPRRGCEHLNFIFAARCEAANCDKSAFTRHPRCDLVREERKRDEARRNPTLGF